MNQHDKNLLTLTYIAWIIFNTLYLLGVVSMMFAAWVLCIELYNNGWWSMLPLAAAIGIGIIINLSFAYEVRRI